MRGSRAPRLCWLPVAQHGLSEHPLGCGQLRERCASQRQRSVRHRLPVRLGQHGNSEDTHGARERLLANLSGQRVKQCGRCVDVADPAINLATYKWVQLVPQATSLVQSGYASCTTSTCAKSFGSSVSAADTLVYALGWYNHAAPTSVTDSQSDTYTLAASQSVPNTNVPPTMVQDAYASNCNSNSCGKQFDPR